MFKRKIEVLLSKTIKPKIIPVVEYPQNKEFGDYSTNLAMQLAKTFKKNPVKIAEEIAKKLKSEKLFSQVQVAKPGFINFKISDTYLKRAPIEILKESSNFGRNREGKGRKARIEFISANPTGPLHVGNARGGPIGDVLANVLGFSGYKVLREYIDNDRGNQVLELGKTLAARALLIKARKDSLAYRGEYTKELALVVKKKLKGALKLSPEAIIKKAGDIGVRILFQEIIKDSKEMGIKFDLIVHESDLQKKAPRILKELEKKGLLRHYEGALWFAPRFAFLAKPDPASRDKQGLNFLKDKDAVVVKSDGSFTYFTADVVYHKEKFKSGFDLVVDVFGSNTLGHVPKLKALATALGFDLSKFKIILYQFVRVRRGKEVIRMSKRAGNFVTVKEVLDEVGLDSFRFFILMHDPNTHMDFDLDLAKKKSLDNPVYYVQYAYARLQSILRKSKIFKASMAPQYELSKAERALILEMAKLPEIVEEIAGTYQVQKLPQYALDLATQVHNFYETEKVLDPNNPKTTAVRLAIVHAASIALKNTLSLMGISAPAKM